MHFKEFKKVEPSDDGDRWVYTGPILINMDRVVTIEKCALNKEAAVLSFEDGSCEVVEWTIQLSDNLWPCNLGKVHETC